MVFDQIKELSRLYVLHILHRDVSSLILTYRKHLVLHFAKSIYTYQFFPDSVTLQPLF